MKVFNGSGGSTKGYGIAAVYRKAINLGYSFDVITGVSISAILSVPLAMNMFEDIDRTFQSKTLHSDMWKHAPVKKNGKFSLCALYVLIKEKIAIGDMSDTRKLISKIITPEIFQKYKDGNYPLCRILAVDFRDGKNHFINLKELSYDDYLDWCMASAAIPFFNLPICKGKMVLYDGGVRNHIATIGAYDHYDVSRSLSVFSRPENFKMADLDWEPKHVIDVLARTNEIRDVEISKKDELDIKDYMKDNQLDKNDHKLIFIPSVLKSLYDTDVTRLKKLYDISYDLLTD